MAVQRVIMHITSENLQQQCIYLLTRKKECKYGLISVVQAQKDNTMKLKIGTTTYNLLVTSTLRLDKNSSISHIIEVSPNTSRFIPTKNASIYLNIASVNLENSLMENESTTSINQENCLFQLRHIRSKFHCLSIYTLCLSFNKTASDIIFRPCTIWTLYEYNSSQKNRLTSTNAIRHF